MRGLINFVKCNAKTQAIGGKLTKLKYTTFTPNHRGKLPFMSINNLQYKLFK